MNSLEITPEGQAYSDRIAKMFDGDGQGSTAETAVTTNGEHAANHALPDADEDPAIFKDQVARMEANEREQGIPPVVIANKGGARSVELTYPPTVNGKRLTKISMRMPLQEDLDAWSQGEIQTIRQFISRLTDVPMVVLDKLSWPDSDALHSLFEGITPDYLLRAKVEE